MIIAGTGHRFLRHDDGRVIRLRDSPQIFILRDVIKETFQELKPKAFIGGGALGFDMVATIVARDLGIPYVLALPFPGHDARWQERDRRVLVDLISAASRVVYVSKGGYARHKMMRRNHWMVDHADAVVAFWDGRNSGTSECVLYAWSRRKEVHNIWRAFKKRTEDFSL